MKIFITIFYYYLLGLYVNECFFWEEKLYKSVKKNNKDDARQNYLAEFACSLRRNVNANMHNKLRP